MAVTAPLRNTPSTSASLATRYAAIRARSVALITPLSAEDACAQSMPDASPAKWHLAHVTWFFETFVLASHEAAFKPHHSAFRDLFNSYYNGIGALFPRAQRGLLTRPSLADVLAYRAAVDQRMAVLLERDPGPVVALIELGLAHEQQHQELLLMDIKHLLSLNPLDVVYRALKHPLGGATAPLTWLALAPGIVEVGVSFGDADGGFHFDNETPRHAVLLAPFELASRPVTNGEYLAFIESGGYHEPRWWLADGWATRLREDWRMPAYWRYRHRDGDGDGAGEWQAFTLGGIESLDLQAPVCHVSHYEADAYASWAGARLPTEFEWEAAAAACAVTGRFAASDYLQPRAVDDVGGSEGTLQQLFGDVWEWTSSAYLPYPGFKVAAGAVGEYNGKFMSNQMVLKGGCCVTPDGHVRASYRNFFYPHQRWAFSGIRLARDV